ncbi:MAG: hypothetical protein NC132_06265 [Corallococcus sp.]|nr:hypothetical protein [Corallococcus sp.]MCM1359787.1 hypothetical protein [Corallococcus sp.]MCM1395687.1 hypothetical protein [Corallococcus sp.]
MDFETFLQQLPAILKDGNNLYFVLYAAATCILTQIAKKIFVNKVKVDVLHKFDFATVLPFIFGTAFAALDLVFVQRMQFSWRFAAQLVVSAATVGALSSVIFKAASSLGGGSLKNLMKDDVFGVFYTQLLYFGNVRKQLENKELKFKDFVADVKLLVQNAKIIYGEECDDAVKKDKLYRLLVGIIDSESIAACVDVLHKALSAVLVKSAEPVADVK